MIWFWGKKIFWPERSIGKKYGWCYQVAARKLFFIRDAHINFFIRFRWSTRKSLWDFTTGPGLNNNVHLESFVNIFSLCILIYQLIVSVMANLNQKTQLVLQGGKWKSMGWKSLWWPRKWTILLLLLISTLQPQILVILWN